MTIDIFEIKKEIVNFLRNQDIFTVSDRGVTTTTQEFNGDNAETEFDLTNTNVKNVRSVTIGGVTQTYGTDYTIDFEGSNPGRITFTTAPAAGTNNVDIEYDYGAGDKIYSDYPRPDLSISSFPRIGFDIMSSVTASAGVGGSEDISNILVEVVIYDPDLKNIEDYGQAVRDAFRSNKKEFYNFKFIAPRSISPLIVSPNKKNEVMQRNYTYEITNYWES